MVKKNTDSSNLPSDLYTWKSDGYIKFFVLLLLSDYSTYHALVEYMDYQLLQGAEEVGQCLRVMAALAEDQNLVPGMYAMVHNYL